MVMSNLTLDPIAASHRGKLRPRAASRPLPLFFAEGGDVQVVDPATLSADEYEAWLGSSFMAAPAPDQTPMTPEQLAALTGIYQDVVRPSLASIGDIIQQSQERAETRAAQAEMPSMRAATGAEQAQATLRDLQGGGFLGSQNIPGLVGGVLGQGAAAFTDTFRGIGAAPFGVQQFVEQNLRPAAEQAIRFSGNELVPRVVGGPVAWGAEALGVPNLSPVGPLTNLAAPLLAGNIPSSLGEVFLLGLGGERVATGAGRAATGARSLVPDAAALRTPEVNRLVSGVVGGGAPAHPLEPYYSRAYATTAPEIRAKAAELGLETTGLKTKADFQSAIKQYAAANPLPAAGFDPNWHAGIEGTAIKGEAPLDVRTAAAQAELQRIEAQVGPISQLPPLEHEAALARIRSAANYAGGGGEIPLNRSNLPRAADVTGGEAGRLVPAGEAPARSGDLPPPPPATSGATGPVSGRFPAEGPLTPAEAQTANAARAGDIYAEMPALRQLPDADLLRAADQAGVARQGIAPLTPEGRIDPTYRHGLELDVAEARHPPVERPVQTVDQLISESNQKGAPAYDALGGVNNAPGAPPPRIPGQEAPPEWASMPGGRPPAGIVAGEKPTGVYNWIMDKLYTSFGGDMGFILRQDGENTLNILKLGETRQVADYAGRARTAEGAAQVNQELRDLPLTKSMGTKINFADFTGGALVGREQLYSRWMANVPVWGDLNRMQTTWVNARRALEVEDFIRANANDPRLAARAQSFANQIERTSGRGSLGTGKVEDALAKTLGPLFTSARFTASIPQRAAALVPFQRLADGSFEMFGPAWRDAVKTHAGFISTVVGTMALAEQLGAKVGWDPNRQSANSKGPPFGTIQIGNTKIDLTAGVRPYVNAVVQVYTGEKNGRDYPRIFAEGSDGRYRGTIAEFLRNKSGPLPGAIFAGVKATGLDSRLGIEKELQFLRPDYWDTGVFNSGKTLDKIAAYVTPLWIQDVAAAIRTDGLAGGLVASPLAFFGAGVTSYELPANEQLRGAANQQLTNPQFLGQHFPPEIIPAIQGKDYYELPSAVQAQLKAANPELVARIEDDARKANNPWQVIYRDGVTAIDQRFADTHYKDAQDLLNNGPSDLGYKDGDKRVNFSTGIKEIQQMQFNEKDALFQKALAASDKKGGGDYKPSEIQQLVQQYYEIGNKFDKPDGSFDYKGYQAATSKFVLDIEARDKDLAYLLAYSVQPKQQTEPVLAMFQSAKENEVKQWNDNRTANPGTQNGWRAANPSQDAVLWYLGYVPDVRSTQAIEFAKMLTEGGSRQPALATSGIVRR